ncbi:MULTISPECIES: PAS domain S-box protein [unclassified Leptolyngbya]|uniref:PAS domain S-box protein n=1 Tax=unclassified Leptolyngbya TaxID=2650499 RepID=UPI00241188DF|nr:MULTISPECIES: PAS domain S-box protein [unclassified Leptolyngbya]
MTRMVESVQDIFFIYSGNRNQLLQVSPTYEQVWGRSCASLYENPLSWMEALHPEDRDRVMEAIASQGQGNSYRQEYRIIRPDGSLRWIYARSASLNGPTGVPEQIVVLAEDVTERKQSDQYQEHLNLALQENETKFRTFLEMASEAVIISNAQGEIVIFNAKAEEIFGYAFNEVLGQPIESLMPERFRQGHQHFRAEYYNQPMRRSMGHAGNLFAQRKDGSEFPIEAGLSAVQVGDERFVLTFLTDISDRKRAEDILRQTEAALREANQELEKRVLERTTELSQMNHQLQQELTERQRTQQILEEQTHLLDLAHDTIMARDFDGVITFWNRGAELMYGWTRTEALGQLTHQLLQTQFPQPQPEVEAELLANGYWEGELTHKRRDGGLIRVASRWVLQRNDEGQPLKVLEINNDITERKRAEESHARLAAIIESSGDGILSTTLDGTINSWNRGAEEIYGYSAQEIIGQSITKLLPADRSHEEVQILERLKHGDRIDHFETVRQHKKGHLIDISLTISPIRNRKGELIGMSKIARDIKRRKQAEEQVRLSSERISLANAELARAARLKDEFLAGMSHELRTPLNAILGLSEALLEEIFGTLTPAQREHLTTIEQSGKHLLELINDILDLSKVESGKMELAIAPVSVQALCDSSLNFVKQQAHHKRIKVHCRIDDELTEIEVDERRIRQLLVNLLSNAVKFTPEGGSIQLQVRADAFRETVDFSITDTGIGISQENIPRLFQPFVQLDSSLSRRYAGTGLGLALVRRISELHGGSVTLESQEGKGSRFTVTLPWQSRTATSELPAEAVPLGELAQHVRQVLIVEDSEAAASQVARYLTELGAATLIHPIGSGAVEAAIQLRPDIIILDILLPDRSGWDVLTELKTNPATQNIPVIVVSVVDERSCALELGAAAYLLKPIVRQQFQLTLSQALGTAQANELAATLTSPPVSTAPTILLAEDSEANIITLSGYLQAHGFEVVLARNGIEAVQMAHQYRPNLILMDIQMPEMDGLEATRQIRAEADLRSIPILALTALAMPGDRERCIEAGAVDYLTKPVSLKRLVALISEYLA